MEGDGGGWVQAYEPNTLLLDNALATMGAGLPSAIAVAILFPEKKVVAVCGDGGFMMNSQACIYIYISLSLFRFLNVMRIGSLYQLRHWHQTGNLTHFMILEWQI
jgi:acetolactate synthase-1/2/3 large subunit